MAGLLAAPGCKQMEKVVNDDQIQDFRAEGYEQGQGLGTSPESNEVPKETPSVIPIPQLPKLGGPVKEIVSRRANCGPNQACLEETRQQLVERGRDVVDQLARLAESDTAAPVKIEAIRALGWLGYEHAIGALTRQLRMDTPIIQREAAWALGQYASPRAVEALAKATKSPFPQVQESAVNGLGMTATPEAVAELTAVLDEGNAELRATATSALGRTQLDEAIPALLRLLSDRSELVRVEAVNALARYEDPRVKPALERVARRGPVEVRARAKAALDGLRATTIPGGGAEPAPP